MAALHELHRPKVLEGLVGQDEAMKRVRNVLKRGWEGRAWIITGHSGTGKTTLANIIALTGADECSVEELDAQWLTPTRIQEIEEHFRYAGRLGGSKTGMAFIVNEYHGMSDKATKQLLTTLERLPKHVVFIFTATLTGASLFESQQIDASAFASRCTQIVLENGPQMRQDCAMRAKAIAQAEGLDGLPDEAYRAAMDAAQGNMRMLLSRIESGAFADDYAEVAKKAAQRVEWQRRLDMIAATKGERYDAERAELRRKLAQ